MSDLISKQAAIDVVDSEVVSANPEHFKSSEKFIEFMDDSDISSFGEWQWVNGFNTALTAVGIDLKKLPPAQPERKRGKWLDIMVGEMPAQACNQCNTFYPLAYTGGGHRYCPNCGADMRGETNDNQSK